MKILYLLTGPIADAMRSSRSRDVISLQDANIIAIRTQKTKHWKQRHVTIQRVAIPVQVRRPGGGGCGGC